MAIFGLALYRPCFWQGRSSDSSGWYYLGAFSAFLSAVVAGLLPVCTRKSKECAAARTPAESVSEPSRSCVAHSEECQQSEPVRERGASTSRVP